MATYWPWWLGSATLAALTIGFWLLLRRPLGVSGSWGNIIGWRESRGLAHSELVMRRNPVAVNNALLAATVAEFGAAATHETLRSAGAPQAATPPRRVVAQTRVQWTVHLVFLLAMLVGGFVVMFGSGQFRIHWDMGPVHATIFGRGYGTWIALFLGGIMVGFGTQMAGGCTSGHGLSGCSRLMPASLTATAVFFAVAVGVSFLLRVFI